MTSGWNATRKVMAGLLVAGAAAMVVPVPAAAQDDARLRRIESELRALQRAVFPGGDGRYFAPEVDTTTPQPQQTVGAPSTTPLTDVLARLDSLETQLARLTARSEENANELRQLEARLQEALAAVPAQPAIQVPSGLSSSSAPSSASRPSGTIPTEASASGPSAERLAAVQAIAKPQTDDAGDDEYTYGFRLWDAGYYPEAQQQLALFLEKYPRHARTSFGRNLLGRAYLDNGQPREAATHFFENYQNDKNGARAADSLLYLAEAMITLNDTNRACIALAEFSETYPAVASGRLREQYDRSRSKVTCRG